MKLMIGLGLAGLVLTLVAGAPHPSRSDAATPTATPIVIVLQGGSGGAGGAGGNGSASSASNAASSSQANASANPQSNATASSNPAQLFGAAVNSSNTNTVLPPSFAALVSGGSASQHQSQSASASVVFQPSFAYNPSFSPTFDPSITVLIVEPQPAATPAPLPPWCSPGQTIKDGPPNRIYVPQTVDLWPYPGCGGS